jgi:hypothetical protein
MLPGKKASRANRAPVIQGPCSFRSDDLGFGQHGSLRDPAQAGRNVICLNRPLSAILRCCVLQGWAHRPALHWLGASAPAWKTPKNQGSRGKFFFHGV